MKSSILPKYRQLAQILRQEIISGKLTANQQLPTEEKLVNQYQCSRETVRKALAELETEGFVRREQGSGSFVNAPNPQAVPFRFAEPINQSSITQYKIIQQEVLPADMEFASLLKVMPGTPVIHIAQLKMENNRPVAYSERHLPQSLCPELLHTDLTRASVHDILAESAELPPVKAVIEMEGRALDNHEAELLDCEPGTPAIIVSRLSYTAPNQPAVWYRGIFMNQYAMEIILESNL